jgi:peptidoglycan/xylan/chitin deacetylase (PgdA/CDA1 family)
MKKIILTVDLETLQSEDITLPVKRLLNIFGDYNVKATFFVVGDLINEYRELVKKISKKYEISSHGLSHKNLKTIKVKELEQEIIKSKKLVESLGIKCHGFRSPFHVPPPNLAKLLKEKKYIYDASVCRSYYPGRYNMRSVPNHPYFASEKNLRKKGNFILEFPVSSFSIFKLPFGLSFLKAFHPFYPLKQIKNNSLFYLHSYELNDYKISENSTLTRFLMNRNKDKAEILLRRLLGGEFKFISCLDFIKSEYPELLRES